MKTIIVVYGGSEAERLEFLRSKNCEAFLDVYKDSVEKVKEFLISNDVLGVEGGSSITLPNFFLGLYQRLDVQIFIYSLQLGVAIPAAIKTQTLEDTYTALVEFVGMAKQHILQVRNGAEPAEMFTYLPYEFIVTMHEFFKSSIPGFKIKNLLSTRFMNVQVLPGHTDNVVLDAYEPFKEQRFTFEMLIYKPVHQLAK